jgi:hypothetical protein
MEAKDLRIGNYIYRKDKIVECDADILRSIEALNATNNRGKVYFPIKLDEKWMLDFGFKYQSRYVKRGYKQTERFYISPRFGQEYWLEIQLAENSTFGHSFVWLHWDIGGGKRFVHLPEGHKLTYVHQLQNLFSTLSGKELELK